MKMRKYIIILFLLLFIPITSDAELNEYDFNGVWTCYIFEKDSDTDSYFHMYQFIFDDHYCTHFVYDYYNNSSGYVLAPHDTGHHYYTIDGTKIIFKAYQTAKEVQFYGRWSGGYLYVSFDGNAWYKFTRSKYQYDSYTSDSVPNAFPLTVYDQLDDGFEIKPGIYIVGIDFPSGDYEIESLGSSSFTIKASQATRADPTTFNLRDGDTFGKITLNDGQVFAFSPGSIILRTYHGLFE